MSLGTSDRFPPFLKRVPGICSNFHLTKIIGRGTFGVVFLGVMKCVPSEKFAFKFLIPTTCGSAHSEIESLQMIGKHPNVIELLTSIRYQDQLVLVFPYFQHNKFSSLLNTVSPLDIRYYMLSLLQGLAYIHSKGIMHRDIKPSNFLYNKNERVGRIIDFGLVRVVPPSIACKKITCMFKKPRMFNKATLKHLTCTHDATSVCSTCLSRKAKHVPRAGTPGYRAPEVLLGYRQQTFAIDVWSAGVILLSLMCGIYPFFCAKTDLHAIAEIVSIFGSERLVRVANNLKIDLILSEDTSGIDLDTFCRNFDIGLQSTSVLNGMKCLLKELLTVDPIKRVCASEALNNDFLNSV